MKKILLFLILGMFLINLASAEVQTLGIFKKGSCINLIQTCYNCSYINISSVIYPNSTVALGQVSMTKTGTNYNYNSCNISSALGIYIINGFGDVDGVVTTFAYDFEVTSNGEKVSLSNIVLVLAFLIVAIIMFVIGNSFENDKYIIKTSFYIFALLMGLLAISSAGIIASESESLSTMSTMGLLLILSVISFIFLYVFIKWSIYTFEQFKTKKEERWN